MQEEAKDKKYIIINNFKVFIGLPIICKKTMTINKTNELKNNDDKPQVSIGYIYKIADVKGKIYIVSTNDYKKRWKQHEKAGDDMPLH